MTRHEQPRAGAGCGEAVAARAGALVGIRYRPQGRRPEEGLDCVGLAALALGIGPHALPHGYSMRGHRPAAVAAELERCGLIRCDPAEMRTGDLLIFRPGPEQLHLAIHTGAAFVHADAGLRCVVERPLPAPWPLIAAWRPGDDPPRGD